MIGTYGLYIIIGSVIVFFVTAVISVIFSVIREMRNPSVEIGNGVECASRVVGVRIHRMANTIQNNMDLYQIILECRNKDGDVKEAVTWEAYSLKEIEFYKGKELTSMVYGNMCNIVQERPYNEEDSYGGSQSTLKGLRVETITIKRFNFMMVIPYLAIILVFAILGGCIAMIIEACQKVSLLLTVICCMPFIAVFIYLLVLVIKQLFTTIISCFGEKTHTTIFSIEKIGSKYTVTYCYRDRNYSLKEKKEKVKKSEYENIKNMKQLPIIVLKSGISYINLE